MGKAIIKIVMWIKETIFCEGDDHFLEEDRTFGGRESDHFGRGDRFVIGDYFGK